MTEQLQMGELETLDGAGNPVVAGDAPVATETPAPEALVPSDEEQALYDKSVTEGGIAAPSPVDDFESEDDSLISPLADGPINVLAVSPGEPALEASPAKIEGAAQLLQTALPEALVTPEGVAEMLKADIGQADVDGLWDALKGQDEATRKGLAAQAINSPNMQMDAKLDLLRKALGNDRDPEFVSKLAMRRAAETEAASEGLEDSPEFLAAAQEFVTGLHSGVNPYEEGVAPAAVQRQTMVDEIRNMYSKADEQTGFLDFAEQFTPIGALPTMNKAVANIYRQLNLTDPNVVGDEARPWVMLGTSLMELRNMYDVAAPHMKEEMARVVLQNLKRNTGLFQDTNDLVTMHILSNIFHKEIFEEEYAGGVGRELSPEERKNLPKEIARIEREFAAAKGNQELRNKLQNEMTVLKMRDKRIPGAEQVFDNIFNLLDIVGLGATAKTTLAFGAKWLPKGLQRTLRVNPKAATNALVEAALDPAQADKMGLSSTDAIQRFLLRQEGDAADGANGFGELNARQVDASETLLKMTAPSNLTAVEQASALEELGAEVGMLISKPKPKVHVNLSSITPTDDGNGAVVEMVFGRTRTRGYATAGNARKAKKDAINDTFGHDAPVEIVQKQADGSFAVVDDATPDSATGEYFQRVKETRHYDTMPQTYGAIQMADDSVDDLTAGVTGSEFLTGLNVFDKFHYNIISSRVREWRAAQGTFRGQLRSISDLGPAKQQRLSKIIKENEGKVLSDRELMHLTGNDEKMVAGYRGFRHVAETMYDLADRHLRNLYLREGMQDIRLDGVRVGWGKPIELASAHARGGTVFDPATGIHRAMSNSEISKLYEAGDQLAHMRYPIAGKTGTNSRLVLMSKGAKAKAFPLPHKGVLPKIEGYYPHITQGNYYVLGVMKDGTKKAIGVAHSKTDMMDYIAARTKIMGQRSAQGKGSTFVRLEAKDAPEMTTLDDWAASMDEVYATHGGPVYGKRDGTVLHNLSKSFGATELDPVAALVRGTEIVSASVTKGELISSMRMRLYNYLQRNEGLFVNPGTLAKDLTEANISAGYSNMRASDTARRYMRQIMLMQNSPDAHRQLTKGVYRRMAHYAHELTMRGLLPKSVGKNVQVGLADAARVGNDVAGAYMGWIHRVYVALAAPKQFLLQGSQSLVAMSYSPTGYVTALRQLFPVMGAVMERMASLHGGKLMKGMGDAEMQKLYPALAKKAGLSVEEFKGLVDTIIQRGLIDSVAHNTMIKDAIGDAAERAMKPRKSGALASIKAGVRTVDRQTFGNLSKVGFEGGENFNQLLTLLTVHAKNKMGGAVDIRKSAYVDDLIGKTAHITGNMVKEATPRYSRSLVKPLFQWVPFQHKMVLMTMPKKMGGSRMLTWDEKARMGLTQFMLFGANATAVTYATHKAIETLLIERLEKEVDGENHPLVKFWREDLTKDAMEGLVFDTMANSVFKALWGKENEDWSDFDMSKTFAPGAGVEFLGERLVSIFALDKDNMMGAQGKYASAIMEYGMTVRNVAQAQLAGQDTVPFNERAAKLSQQGAMTLLPMYGRYLTAAWAKEHDAYISAGGQLSEGISSEFEAQMYGALGINTKDRASYYAAMDKLAEEFSDPSGAEAEVKKLADQYWRNLVLYGVKLNKEAPTDAIYDALLMEHLRNEGMLFSALGARDGSVINEYVAKKLENVMKGEGDSAETLFVERITQKLAAGQFGEGGPKAAVYLRNLPFVMNDPTRLQMVEDAFQAVVHEPEPQNMTEDSTMNEGEN